MSQFELPHKHGEVHLQNIRFNLAQSNKFDATSELFRQLSNPTRLKIFWILCHHEECVINIAGLLDMSSPAVFHHLCSLHDSGLISSRRDGKEVYYKASDTEGCRLLHKTVEQIMEIACPESEAEESSSPEKVIRDVHEYLVDHLSDRITIDDLSRRFLLNPTTLKRVFKDVYGNSLAAHMKEHRMEKAAELLTRTEMSIFEIALTVGYESQSRFTAAFKESYGELPTVYRKNNNPPGSRTTE